MLVQCLSLDWNFTIALLFSTELYVQIWYFIGRIVLFVTVIYGTRFISIIWFSIPLFVDRFNTILKGRGFIDAVWLVAIWLKLITARVDSSHSFLISIETTFQWQNHNYCYICPLNLGNIFPTSWLRGLITLIFFKFYKTLTPLILKNIELTYSFQ